MRLWQQLAVAIGSALAVLLITAYFFLHRVVNEQIHVEQTEWASTLAGTVAEVIVRDTAAGNPQAVASMLSSIADNQPRIAYAYVTDFEGRLFAHSFSTGFPKGLLARVGKEATAEQIVDLDGIPVLDIRHPLVGNSHAMIHLGVDMRATTDRERRAGLMRLSILLISGVGILCIVIALSRRLTVPLRDISRAMRSYATGNYVAPRISPGMAQEVQLVGASLSQMIEERELLYQVLEESNAELEEKVKARTEELEIARDTAEKLAHVKSNFLANISHEIRTPMNAIYGMAFLIKKSGLTGIQLERLEKLQKSAEHLLGLLDAVLDLSKMDAGKFVLEAEPFSVEEVVRIVKDMLLQRANAKGIILSSNIHDVPHDLVGDATRLRQALLNFAGNAIKFTEHGNVTMSVRAISADKSSALLKFEVRDTGIGITDEQKARLFNAFEQADNSTTRKYGGTGLGLAITKKIAELMGGEAGVESEIGKGSTFWFTARLQRSGAMPRQGNGQETIGAHELYKREFFGRRMLLVEDEPINREVIHALLSEFGVHLDTAENGSEAVQLVESNPAYDLALMDMQMPVMDGLEATRRIRELPNGRQVPIIALTANAFVEDRNRCIAAGMNAFITKPVDPEILFETLLKELTGTPSEYLRGRLNTDTESAMN